MTSLRAARRVADLRDSVIRDMTRLAVAHDAVNLSQGFPDFGPPHAVVDAAIAAIQRGENQYSPSWGDPVLRERLAEQYRDRLGWDVDAARHVTVTCGVTEALGAALLATVDPGDEVLVPEPAHDNYRPACELAGAVPVAVPLEGPEYRLDVDRLDAATTTRTRVLLLNTPHNPTGRVFDAGELDALAELVVRRDLLLLTDEIYDRLVYDGRRHLFPGSLDALRDRTITVSGLGKTFAVTGPSRSPAGGSATRSPPTAWPAPSARFTTTSRSVRRRPCRPRRGPRWHCPRSTTPSSSPTTPSAVS
jgi:aminotransferase